MTQRNELLALAEQFDRDPVCWGFSQSISATDKKTIASALLTAATAQVSVTVEELARALCETRGMNYCAAPMAQGYAVHLISREAEQDANALLTTYTITKKAE